MKSNKEEFDEVWKCLPGEEVKVENISLSLKRNLKQMKMDYRKHLVYDEEEKMEYLEDIKSLFWFVGERL